MEASGPFASLSEEPLQPLRDDDETAAKRRAARQLIGNHARVVPFACRAHAPPGVPPVMAPLADPNNASPVRWHEDDVDCALRHVAHALLAGAGVYSIAGWRRRPGADGPRFGVPAEARRRAAGHGLRGGAAVPRAPVARY